MGTEKNELAEIEFLPIWEYYEDFATVAKGLAFDHANWIEGQPFEVRVPCSGRRSTFGRELNYRQFHLLLLRILYKDGEAELIPVEIPDGRRSRKVTVMVMSHGLDSQ